MSRSPTAGNVNPASSTLQRARHFIRHWAHRLDASWGHNARTIRALRNKFEGRRCFVVGNGPSLQIPDLHRLRDEVTIASNKIFLAFAETVWRPTLYTIIDSVVLSNNLDRVRALGLRSVFPEQFRPQLHGVADVSFVRLLPHGEWDGEKYLTFAPAFSTDPLIGFYHGESVTYFNIQLATYLGCNPIVLIGVNFSYLIPATRVPNFDFGYILTGEGEQNHFSKDYTPVGERWTMPNLTEQRACLEYATRQLELGGVQLLNASRETALDVVPRVDFDSLVG